MDNEKIKPCPFCGWDNPETYGFIGRYVLCRACFAQGSKRSTDYEAIIAWNAAIRLTKHKRR